MKKYLILILLLLAPPVWGTTYYVRSDGTVKAANKANATSCSSNSTAMNMAQAITVQYSNDDIIEGCSNTYTTTMKPWYSGPLGHPVTYQNFTINATGKNNGLIADGLNYIIFQDIVVDNATIDSIYIMSAADHLRFIRITSQHAGRHGFYSLLSSDSTDMIVSDGVYSGSGGSGIYLVNHSSGFTISGNQVYGNSQAAVDYTAGIRINDPDARNNVVEYNTVYNNGTTGVGNGRGGGIWVDGCGDNNIVRYNSVHNNIYTGIFIEVTSHAQVYYNIVYSNSGYSSTRGIAISGRALNLPLDFPSTGNLIYNNVVYGNNIGIAIFSDLSGNHIVDNNVVRNNISCGNATQQLLVLDGGENDGNIGSGNIYTYNAFCPEATNFIKWGSANISTYATFDNAYGGATHSMTGDPLFVSTATPNFRLQAGSPAINAGVNVGLTADHERNTVPTGSAPDIGAYEFISTYKLPSPPSNIIIR